MKLLCKFLL
ncbi:uncharacterized protein CELE_Y54F10AM.15 [Caenorhabditis elegans]|uniref:Uncharacterized protein n=1 Tax=Caenorhabditis elegans TaxID=6239 RepID=A0A2K5ATV7_CAEEL|nr:Uncharacterized protein CELE_Y54F10AM.15 [Caenorhabditis elegans]SPC47549.1 Uncharacterized protein CELE_Y54F10AM.15 [Caenorhabditis elegans]|eukprot:NP_001348754.1 Uncharacterized protein CELE_Y54F10AM.15 [Caenorhabditis elegans]